MPAIRPSQPPQGKRCLSFVRLAGETIPSPATRQPGIRQRACPSHNRCARGLRQVYRALPSRAWKARSERMYREATRTGCFSICGAGRARTTATTSRTVLPRPVTRVVAKEGAVQRPRSMALREQCTPNSLYRIRQPGYLPAGVAAHREQRTLPTQAVPAAEAIPPGAAGEPAAARRP